MGLLENEARREKEIAQAILYFASDGGKKYLPSMPRVVSFEFIAAVTEHLSGETEVESYFEWCGEERIYQTNKKMTKIFDRFDEKLPSTVRSPIEQLITFHFVSDHGQKWYQNSFENWFRAIAEPPLTRSTFSLSVATIEHIKTDVIPCFDPETINHLKAIADCMKKYIEKDLKHIREHFGW